MSERSPEQIHEQIHEQIRQLLDRLYRADSGRILATLIRLLPSSRKRRRTKFEEFTFDFFVIPKMKLGNIRGVSPLPPV